jgi:hypothetical protein
MTQDEIEAINSIDNSVDLDNESIEQALDEALVEAQRIEEEIVSHMPIINDDNKMVNQLDDVRRESEEKATEIFNIIEDISFNLIEKKELIDENIEIINSNIKLFKMLSAKFPEVDAFKTQLEKSEKSLKNINIILKMLDNSDDSITSVMNLMQYQDIHRQKIERVINVMRSLAIYMNSLFESKIDDSKRVESTQHLPGDKSDNLTSREDIEELLAKFSS